MKRFSSPREYRRSRKRYEQISSLFRSGESSSLLHTMVARGPVKPMPTHRAGSVALGVTAILGAGGLLYAILLFLL